MNACWMKLCFVSPLYPDTDTYICTSCVLYLMMQSIKEMF